MEPFFSRAELKGQGYLRKDFSARHTWSTVPALSFQVALSNLPPLPLYGPGLAELMVNISTNSTFTERISGWMNEEMDWWVDG